VCDAALDIRFGAVIVPGVPVRTHPETRAALDLPYMVTISILLPTWLQELEIFEASRYN